MKARATSFATYKDLVNYALARDAGMPPAEAYKHGDNGIGCWGDRTATEKVAMVAVPKAEMIKRFGESKKARGAPVTVTVSGRTISAEVRDCAPDGIVDLNPGALVRLGLHPETELSADATWEWA